jgi:hypothetical protein
MVGAKCGSAMNWNAAFGNRRNTPPPFPGNKRVKTISPSALKFQPIIVYNFFIEM